MSRKRFPAKIEGRGKKAKPVDGVWYIEGTGADGKPEKIYIIRYWRGGKRFEDKVGRERQDDMTPAKASTIRAAKIKGTELSNVERREAERQKAEADAGRWTLDRLLDAYQEDKGAYSRHATDRTLYNKHLKPLVGNKEPAELDQLKIDGLRIRLLKTLMPGTVASILGFLIRLSSYGTKKKGVPGITFHVELPRDGSVRTESMTEDQMTAYLKAAAKYEKPFIGGILAFELLTGMRAGEVRNLEWSAVDFGKGYIHIRNPKGGRDEFIPVNGAALDLLRSLPRDPANPFAFQGERGGRVAYDNLREAGNKLKKDAGLPDTFRPNHGLRHSFASHLASSGEVDIYKLQKLLTHKSPLMTQRYSHLTDKALRNGAEVMGRLGTAAAKDEDESTKKENAG
jgi:integrase